MDKFPTDCPNVFGPASKYDPAKHILRDHKEQAQFLKRELNLHDRISLIQWVRTGTWSVILWSDPNQKEFKELMSFLDVRKMDKTDVDSLREWRAGRTRSGKMIIEELKEADRAYDRSILQHQEEQADKRRFIRSKMRSVQKDNPMLLQPIPFSLTPPGD
jgi:hypothetical protein